MSTSLVKSTLSVQSTTGELQPFTLFLPNDMRTTFLETQTYTMNAMVWMTNFTTTLTPTSSSGDAVPTQSVPSRSSITVANAPVESSSSTPLSPTKIDKPDAIPSPSTTSKTATRTAARNPAFYVYTILPAILVLLAIAGAIFLLRRRKRRSNPACLQDLAEKQSKFMVPAEEEEEIIDQGLERDLGNVPISARYQIASRGLGTFRMRSRGSTDPVRISGTGIAREGAA